MIDLGSLADWFSGLASAAAVVVALWLARKSDRDRMMERQQKNNAVARRLLAEVMNIANFFHTIRASFEDDFDGLLPPQPPPLERWRLTRPLIGLSESDAIYLNDEGLILLMEADPKLYEKVISVAVEQRVLVRLLAEYGSRRNALLEMLPEPVEAENTILIGVVPDGPQFARLRAHARAVEDLLDQAWVAAKEGKESALDVAHHIGPAMKKFLGDPKFPTIGLIQDPQPSANSSQ